MIKQTEALKLALKTLEKMGRVMKQSPDTEKAIVAIRKALAEHIEQHLEMVEQSTCKQALQVEQPAQEQSRSQKMREIGITRRPKGWVKDGDENAEQPAQPSKPWVGLTDKDIIDSFDQVPSAKDEPWWLRYGRTIEAKLRELNEHREKNV